MLNEDLLAQLNPQQRKAVEINQGSLLVFAGAGSGKTKVITTKIAYAIENALVKPYQILAVTFTNKACKEMQERVASMVDPDLASQPMIKTFHSFGVWMLRKYGMQLGIKSDFTIYDERESLALLCQCFPDDDKEELKEHSKNIALLKEKGLEMTGKYASAYEAALRETGNIDFGDMIVKPIELLKTHPEIREEVQKRFPYILVDEYQDTNPSQLELLKLITGPQTFICVVGDDDQSIYRFRSSDVRTILSFPDQFPNTQTVVLNVNYRCSQSILAAAKDVIDNNRSRQKKDLVASNKGGEKPVLMYLNSELDEADEIARIIQARPCSENLKTAVLYRTNAQSKTFENKLTYYRIPYRVVGDLSFYSREEVVDATALLKLMVNRQDTVSFARIVTKLTEGVGRVSVEKILEDSRIKGIDLLDACKSNSSIKGKSAQSLALFTSAWEEKLKLLGTVPNNIFVEGLLKDFKLYEYYKKREEKEAMKYDSRVEDLNQFVIQFAQPEYAEGFEGIFTYLEFRALDSSFEEEGSEQTNAVTLITMHRTKGLEFDRVFVTGLEDSVFFHSSSVDKDEEEEERRLVYVAMTRAKKKLYLTSCATRFMYGMTNYNKPVMFLDEIQSSNLEVSDRRTFRQPQGYGGYGSYGNYANRYNNRNYASSPSYSWKEKKTNETYLKPGRDTLDDWEPPVKKVTLIKKANAVSSQPLSFSIGDRVQNEILGKGTVTAKKKFGNRDTIVVSFDDGRQATYLEANAPLTKI